MTTAITTAVIAAAIMAILGVRAIVLAHHTYNKGLYGGPGRTLGWVSIASITFFILGAGSTHGSRLAGLPSLAQLAIFVGALCAFVLGVVAVFLSYLNRPSPAYTIHA
jgi:hypothetical protein